VRRLLRSELRKLLSTNTWWLFALAVVAFAAADLALGALRANVALHQHEPAVPAGLPADQAQQLRDMYRATSALAVVAASLYTSGRYFGLLFVLLLGILAVTNEHLHGTATATFLATPRRELVIAGKLAATVLAALCLCVAITLVSLVTGAIVLSANGAGLALGDGAVIRAVLLNLLAYAVWAVLGVGLGTLVRGQVAAVVVALSFYLVASTVASAVVGAVAYLVHAPWLNGLAVVIPSVASDAMTSGGAIPGIPPWWLGALVLLGYAVVAGGSGTVLVRRRDVG
jgi:ABC-type transport system involved in multi-copper enzyme maturation permease subunit